MEQQDPKKIVKDIAKQVGKHATRCLLINAGLSPSLADKLVGGRYSSEIGQLVRRAILDVHEELKRQAS